MGARAVNCTMLVVLVESGVRMSEGMKGQPRKTSDIVALVTRKNSTELPSTFSRGLIG